MVDFWKEDELQTFGMEVATKYHTATIADAAILFVFRDPPKKNGGRVIAGTAEKVPKKWKDIGVVEEDFMITIARSVWEEMSSADKEALIDHELTHCTVTVKDNGEAELSIRPHDIEDFIEVYERHGAWQPQLRALITAITNRTDQVEESNTN
jgi:hypothetical protein